MTPVAVELEVARIENLLELTAERHGEHRLVEVNGLAHEREAAAGDDGARGGEVVDELVLAERLIAEVPLHDLFFQVATHPVDPTLDAGLLERLGERRIALARRVDEDVIAAPPLRGE